MFTGLKAKIIGQIIELLTVPTYVENEVMYPEVRALLPELEDDVPDRVPTRASTARCVSCSNRVCWWPAGRVIGQVAGSERDEAYRASWRGIISTLWRARPQ
jgi:hypothetical protein